MPTIKLIMYLLTHQQNNLFRFQHLSLLNIPRSAWSSITIAPLPKVCSLNLFAHITSFTLVIVVIIVIIAINIIDVVAFVVCNASLHRIPSPSTRLSTLNHINVPVSIL
eukprot:m.188607 g.188607  ORF g.188607 m.188607 type:complete len:109 (-) comp32350_c0_seq3:173-499(-)